MEIEWYSRNRRRISWANEEGTRCAIYERSTWTSCPQFHCWILNILRRRWQARQCKVLRTQKANKDYFPIATLLTTTPSLRHTPKERLGTRPWIKAKILNNGSNLARSLNSHSHRLSMQTSWKQKKRASNQLPTMRGETLKDSENSKLKGHDGSRRSKKNNRKPRWD